VAKQAQATRSGAIDNVDAGRVAAQPQSGETTQDGPAAFVAPRLLPDDYDETQPVVFEKTSYERKWAIYDEYDVVDETITTTKVNAANQTTVVTETTQYTVYHTPSAGGYKIMLSPTPTGTPSEEPTPSETKPVETKPVDVIDPPAETKPTDPPTESTKPAPTETTKPDPAPSPTTVVAS